MKIKQLTATAVLLCAGLIASSATAAEEHYKIDIKGQHAFIQFKIKHLGFSWMYGEFRTFKGAFTFDAVNPKNNSVHVTIDSNSIDTNHAERNKHLRSADFFAVKQYPSITYISTSYEDQGHGHGILHGTLTLRGVSKPVDLTVNQIGTGKDPWGGYRRGFEAHTTLHLSDYGMPFAPKLGPVSEDVELNISVEGIKEK
jgi:polyisoprenoid-binding protein YceI